MKIIKDSNGGNFFTSNNIEDFIALDNYFKLIGEEFWWGGVSPSDGIGEFANYIHKDNYSTLLLMEPSFIPETYLIYLYKDTDDAVAVDKEASEEVSKVREFVKIYGGKK